MDRWMIGSAPVNHSSDVIPTPNPHRGSVYPGFHTNFPKNCWPGQSEGTCYGPLVLAHT